MDYAVQFVFTTHPVCLKILTQLPSSQALVLLGSALAAASVPRNGYENPRDKRGALAEHHVGVAGPPAVGVAAVGGVAAVPQAVHTVQALPPPQAYVNGITVQRDVAVPVPRPFPVTIEREVPFEVKVPYNVPVDQPYPVHVDRPYTVAVPRPVPVKVIKDVPVPVYIQVPVQVRVPFPVAVPRPVPVPHYIPRPYTIHKPHPVTLILREHVHRGGWW